MAIGRMTQLILDSRGPDPVIMPEASRGRYSAAPAPLSEDVEMVPGRLTKELRGDVWQVAYEYNYFKQKMKDRVIAACRKGMREPIWCDFLPPESSGELLSSLFWVMSFEEPKFQWSHTVGGTPVPFWGGFSLTLREVEPSD